MLTSKREKRICEKYSAHDADGKVHCHECPLNKGLPDQYDFRCKANAHYNRHTKEWEYDDDIATGGGERKVVLRFSGFYHNGERKEGDGE